MSKLLEVEGLSKHFGSFAAVDGISFSVARGEIVGFLGPNGAGKSTTMKMATGFLEPTSGRIVVDGFDMLEQPIEAKHRIGYLPEGAPAYGDMTPLQLLRFMAKIRQIPKEKIYQRVDAVIDRLQLQSVKNQPIDTLSKGFKRRVGIAQAILHEPDLLILDEPTDGLDPNQKHEVRQLLNGLSSDHAVIISTHILEEVEAICSRVILIADGKLVADKTPRQLLELSRHHKAVGLRVAKNEKKKAIEALSKVKTVQSIETLEEDRESAQIIAFPTKDEDLMAEIKKAMNSAKIEPTELFVERGKLDEVFRELTKAA